MSYDIDLGNKVDFNVTYNVAKMFYHCSPDLGIRTLYGLTGKQSIPLLTKWLVDFTYTYKDLFESMNPSNGWGSRESCCIVIARMIQAANDNPRSKWSGD